jgi:hypothetical protein
VVGSIRIVVAIFSYDGGLYFGVTGDYDGAPDIDVLTSGIEHGMEELLALTEPEPAPKPPKRAADPRKNGHRPKAAKARLKRAAAKPTSH